MPKRPLPSQSFIYPGSSKFTIRWAVYPDPAWISHDDVTKWKHFPCYWPFVRGIHRSPVNSPHKGQWRGALMFSLICARINGWVNNREAGDLRRHRGHYDVTVMSRYCVCMCTLMLPSLRHLQLQTLSTESISSTPWFPFQRSYHCDLMRLAFEFAQRSRNLFRLGGNRRDRLYQQPGTIFFCCDSKKYTYGIITFSLHPPHCLGINSLIIFLKLFLQRGKTYYSEICGISRLGQVVLDPFTVPNDKNLPAVRAVQGDCQLPVKTMGIPTHRESPQSIATDVIPTYN